MDRHTTAGDIHGPIRHKCFERSCCYSRWYASFNTLRRRRAELKQIGRCESDVLVEARGPLEVRWWLSSAREELLSTEVVRHSFISWIVGQPADTGWRSGAKQENLRRLAWEEIEEVASTAYLKWQIVDDLAAAEPDSPKEAIVVD